MKITTLFRKAKLYARALSFYPITYISIVFLGT